MKIKRNGEKVAFVWGFPLKIMILVKVARIYYWIYSKLKNIKSRNRHLICLAVS
jgi:hypothetical protein